MALGQEDPWAMAERMGPKLIEEWQAYEHSEPLSQPWLRAAMVAQQVASLGSTYIMTKVPKGTKINWPQIEDFTLDPHKKPRPVKKQSTEEALAVAMQMGGVRGGN